MARKNLLIGLSDPGLPAGNSSGEANGEARRIPPPHLGIMGTRGPIGAVTRSIEQIKAQSVYEIAPDQIDASLIDDRLETSAENHSSLLESIREHGQQVPVLVRPNPVLEGRYQIVYGRRRLRAVKELGLPVRAIVKPLTDEQLVVAQGQENSARTDLSFIEKALFAAKLEETGFPRATIMASLSVDKTGLSRLISAAVKIPREIILAVGSAPRAGRDRWVELASRLENPLALANARGAIGMDGFAQKPSDERFDLILKASAPARAADAGQRIWKAPDGTFVAQIKEDYRHVTLAIDKNAAGEFGAYLIEQLPEIFAAFKRREDR